jgi:hypothetical protein
MLLQGFQKTFSRNFLSVPILEFLAPLEGFQRPCANQQADYYRGEDYVFKGVISKDDNNRLVELGPAIKLLQEL